MADRNKKGLRTPICTGKTRGGRRCKAYAQSGSRFCFFHDPKSKRKAVQARRKGGKVGLERVTSPAEFDGPVELSSAEDVRKLLSECVTHLRDGRMLAKTCTTIGYLAQVVLKSIEQGELEERLRKLEELIGDDDGRNQSGRRS